MAMATQRLAFLAALTLLGIASPMHAQPPTLLPLPPHDGKPMPMFSIAGPRPGQKPNGPLFHRVKAALAAASVGNGAGFRRFLAPHPELLLQSFDGDKLRDSAFTVEVIRAAATSCLGPFSFDERPSWVQLSWVCRTDRPTPLSKFLTFRRSAELSLTVWLEEGRIKRIDAIEPLWIPGRHSIPMDGYQQMQGSK